MRTFKCCLVSLVIVAVVASIGVAQPKKYEIKSGIVTFESKTLLGKFEMKSKTVVYFDDYGMKECKETFEGDVLKESFLSDGTNLYTLMHSKKEAFERGPASRGTELKFDWNEVSKNTNKDYKVEKLPSVSIAGKTCESFVINTKDGKNTFAGYKGVTFLTRVENKQMTVDVKATKFEENVPVPSAKFAIPAGYSRKK